MSQSFSPGNSILSGISLFERFAWLAGGVFLMLAWAFLGGGSLPIYASGGGHAVRYYGATAAEMNIATGVSINAPGTAPIDGPWPQNADNYCFAAAVQAMTNYAALKNGLPIPYPSKEDQGPASREPADAQPGQIIYDMNTELIPEDGPLPLRGEGKFRRPYVLSNIAYDFGGDPHTHAVAAQYEVEKLGLTNYHYHQHIFHTTVDVATKGIASALIKYPDPVVAFVNQADHSVLVSGVWAKVGYDKKVKQVNSLGVYNMWNQQQFGTYFNGMYYSRVSYADWVSEDAGMANPYGGTSNWFTKYGGASGIVPDPSIGRYQAGEGTTNPDARHWIGNYVIVQRDNFKLPADFAFDEHNRPLYGPVS